MFIAVKKEEENHKNWCHRADQQTKALGIKKGIFVFIGRQDRQTQNNAVILRRIKVWGG